jgi:tetratricopeptide (TPR) repeat protein
VFSIGSLRTLAATLIFSTTVLALPTANAWAQTAPTAEQIEAAKKAFAEGKTLYDQKKLSEATEKFKESYRLSKKPLLLYYVGLSLDESGNKELALFYYKKFMTEAAPAVEQRKEAGARIKTLEAELFSAGATPTPSNGPAKEPPKEPAKPTEPAAEKVAPSPAVKIKPAGTYTAADVQHSVVEDAPPGKPLDLSAVVPNDAGWTVSLHYRSAGEEKFTTKIMRKRYNELVARIPIDKIKANSVQYYIEVKDQAGTVIDRKGKPSSPNIIYLDAAVSPRFYPDFTDEGPVKDAPSATSQAATISDDNEDPMNNRATPPKKAIVTPDDSIGGETGDGVTKNRPSSVVLYGSTGAAAGLLGVGIVFYVRARNASKTVEDESCKAQPCTKAFDSYLQDVESIGKRDTTISNVTLGIGLAAAGVAGYFWYKNLTAKKSKLSSETAVLPVVSSDFAGAAALWSF